MGKTLNIRSIQLVPGSMDRDVVMVLLVYLIWTIPWGLINPFLSPYFFELSKGDYFLTGLLNGIPFFTMIFSVFIFGWIVDRIGSKIVMIAGFILFITLFITLIFITDPLLFFLDYILMYSLLGCFNPAVWKYASLTSKKDIFGSMGAFASLGYFIGAVASGWIYETIGMTALFLLSVMICAAGLIVTLFTRNLRNSNHQPSAAVSSAVNPGNSFSTSFIATLVGSKVLIVLFVISIVNGIQASFSGMFATIYFLGELSTPASLIGITFGAATLAGAFASHYTGKIGETRGYKEILVISYVAYSFVWISFVFSTNSYIIPVLLYIVPVYVGLFVAGPTIVSDSVKEDRRGAFLGVLSASQNIGYAAGSILGGLLGGLLRTLRWNFGVSAVISGLLVVFIAIFLKENK